MHIATWLLIVSGTHDFKKLDVPTFRIKQINDVSLSIICIFGVGMFFQETSLNSALDKLSSITVAFPPLYILAIALYSLIESDRNFPKMMAIDVMKFVFFLYIFQLIAFFLRNKTKAPIPSTSGFIKRLINKIPKGQAHIFYSIFIFFPVLTMFILAYPVLSDLNPVFKNGASRAPGFLYEQYFGIIVLMSIAAYFFSDSIPFINKDKTDILSSNSALKDAKAVASHAGGVWSGQIDGNDLYISTEDRAVVIGPPGTGKTAFLINQLMRWSDTGRPFICVDIKPEIYGIMQKELKNKGYKVITYNPTSQTGQRYNILDDVDSLEAVGELAASLMPAEDAKNTVFFESARDFFDAIVTHLSIKEGENPSLPDVRDFLSNHSGFTDVMDELLESPDMDVRDIAQSIMTISKNDRMIGSIFATFRANLRFLRYPAIRDSLSRSDFSLKELCGNKVCLFLQVEEKHRETTAQLWTALIAHVMRYFISHTDRPPVLLLFDEIGNAKPVPGLLAKLNTIRSRQMPTWLYWQSREQMQVYGQKSDEGPGIILGACDFQMVFRLNDNSSAEYFSNKIGTIDRLVEATSVTSSSSIGGDSVTDSKQLSKEQVIDPHEIQQLDDGEVICTYRGKSWRGYATPYYVTHPEYNGIKPSVLLGDKYTALKS